LFRLTATSKLINADYPLTKELYSSMPRLVHKEVPFSLEIPMGMQQRMDYSTLMADFVDR
jgi:hypothetical protein